MKLKEIFNKQGDKAPAHSPGNSGSEFAEGVVAQLVELEKKNALTGTAEEYVRDREFVKLLEEYPVHAAVRIYDAEKKAASEYERGREDAVSEIYKRKSMPRAMRTAQPAEAETDFSKMSSEEFARLKNQLAKRR
ncbi:MAG: hypothetical protein IJO93_06360 [Clostridia bacterium]|nr:hypothetical protein [Clostridia bacterium]